MDSETFTKARKILKKTQKEMAELLGISVKAVRSYEQEWRQIPGHVERQMYFLLSRKREIEKKNKPCWTVKKCPPDRKKQCPAFEFKAGKLCWFINGTICEGEVQRNWDDKMKICQTCDVWKSLL